MASHAGVVVHISCGADPGSEGFDGWTDSTLWLSWQNEGDPTHRYIRVHLLGTEFFGGRPGGAKKIQGVAGDDAVKAAGKADAEFAREGGANVKIGTTTHINAKRIDTAAYFEFDNVDAVDAACLRE